MVPKSSLKTIDCIRREIKLAADDTSWYFGSTDVNVGGSGVLTSRLRWLEMDLLWLGSRTAWDNRSFRCVVDGGGALYKLSVIGASEGLLVLAGSFYVVLDGF